MAVPRPNGNPNIRNIKSPGRPKGVKNAKTIAIEKAREAYAAKMVTKWGELTDVQLKEALKKENRQEREFVINQTIGRATETKKLEAEIDITLDF